MPPRRRQRQPQRKSLPRGSITVGGVLYKPGPLHDPFPKMRSRQARNADRLHRLQRKVNAKDNAEPDFLSEMSSLEEDPEVVFFQLKKHRKNRPYDAVPPKLKRAWEKIKLRNGSLQTESNTESSSQSSQSGEEDEIESNGKTRKVRQRVVSESEYEPTESDLENDPYEYPEYPDPDADKYISRTVSGRILGKAPPRKRKRRMRIRSSNSVSSMEGNIDDTAAVVVAARTHLRTPLTRDRPMTTCRTRSQTKATIGNSTSEDEFSCEGNEEGLRELSMRNKAINARVGDVIVKSASINAKYTFNRSSSKSNVNTNTGNHSVPNLSESCDSGTNCSGNASNDESGSDAVSYANIDDTMLMVPRKPKAKKSTKLLSKATKTSSSTPESNESSPKKATTPTVIINNNISYHEPVVSDEDFYDLFNMNGSPNLSKDTTNSLSVSSTTGTSNTTTETSITTTSTNETNETPNLSNDTTNSLSVSSTTGTSNTTTETSTTTTSTNETNETNETSSSTLTSNSALSLPKDDTIQISSSSNEPNLNDNEVVSRLLENNYFGYNQTLTSPSQVESSLEDNPNLDLFDIEKEIEQIDTNFFLCKDSSGLSVVDQMNGTIQIDSSETSDLNFTPYQSSTFVTVPLPSHHSRTPTVERPKLSKISSSSIDEESSISVDNQEDYSNNGHTSNEPSSSAISSLSSSKNEPTSSFSTSNAGSDSKSDPDDKSDYEADSESGGESSVSIEI